MAEHLDGLCLAGHHGFVISYEPEPTPPPGQNSEPAPEPEVSPLRRGAIMLLAGVMVLSCAFFARQYAITSGLAKPEASKAAKPRTTSAVFFLVLHRWTTTPMGADTWQVALEWSNGSKTDLVITSVDCPPATCELLAPVRIPAGERVQLQGDWLRLTYSAQPTDDTESALTTDRPASTIPMTFQMSEGSTRLVTIHLDSTGARSSLGDTP